MFPSLASISASELVEVKCPGAADTSISAIEWGHLNTSPQSAFFKSPIYLVNV
jgi:hypothetical protein